MDTISGLDARAINADAARNIRHSTIKRVFIILFEVRQPAAALVLSFQAWEKSTQ